MNLTELHHLGRQLMSGAEAGMRGSNPAGLKPVELQVLEALINSGPSPVGTIAQQIGFAQSRVSTAVAALHMKGMVELGQDPADRRRTMVGISERARARAEEVRAREATPVLAGLFPGLTDQELAQLVTVLDRLQRALGEPAPPPEVLPTG